MSLAGKLEREILWSSDDLRRNNDYDGSAFLHFSFRHHDFPCLPPFSPTTKVKETLSPRDTHISRAGRSIANLWRGNQSGEKVI